MKKIIVLLLSLLMVILFAACGGPQDHSSAMAIVSSRGSAKSTNGKTLVVYFSATGNTRRLAETAATALNADLFEIKPEQPYTSQDLDYNDKSTRATVEQNDSSARPKIANQIEKLGQYDTIVLAYPIWWGHAPRIMETLMESYDFSGKTMTAICTSGGSDIGSSHKELTALGSKSVQWKDGHLFTFLTSVDELQLWFKKNGILKS